jgi:hypothetical protein
MSPSMSPRAAAQIFPTREQNMGILIGSMEKVLDAS